MPGPGLSVLQTLTKQFQLLRILRVAVRAVCAALFLAGHETHLNLSDFRDPKPVEDKRKSHLERCVSCPGQRNRCGWGRLPGDPGDNPVGLGQGLTGKQASQVL